MMTPFPMNVCRRLLTWFRRGRDSDDGALTAEFAVTAPVLTLAILGTVEFGMIMFVSTLMESGLRDAARFGITGAVPDGQSRLERILDVVETRTLGLVDMNGADVQVVIYPSFADIGRGEAFVDGNGNGEYDAGETYTDENGNGQRDADIGVAGTGGPGDVVVYRMAYDWPLLTHMAAPLMGQDGAFTLRASVAVRNEPWDDADGI